MYRQIFNRLGDLAQRHHARTLADINLKLIDAYRNERMKAGIVAKTMFTETVVIRQMVNFALTRGDITTDPLQGLRLKKPKPTPQPCWTPEETAQILQAAPAWAKPLLVVLAGTGMRVGELRHLTWEDVDFTRNLLHIRPKGDWKPKTGDQRAIPMGSVVLQTLVSLPRRCSWVFTALRSAKYPKGDNQFSDRYLLACLKKVLKKLGLEGHVHTFRHAFISNALTQGIPEAVVRQWVGHVDAEIIKLYTHIADASSQAAMQRLGDAQSKALQQGARHDGDQTSGSGSAQTQHSERSHEDD
jgi:integrase/recombinase XerD